MSKPKVIKSKLPRKEESIVNKAKPKVSTSKTAKPVEKKVVKPTIASLTKELEELKVMYETVITGKDKHIEEWVNWYNECNVQLKMAQRPWYVKIFDLFADKPNNLL